MTRTAADLLAGLAKATAKETAEQVAPAPAPRRVVLAAERETQVRGATHRFRPAGHASQVRTFAPSVRQVEMIRVMLTERFEAAEATRRFEYMNWTTMSRPQFDAVLNFLKATPRLAKAEVATAVAVASVQVPDLKDGIYTIVFPDESYRTLRIRTQDAKANFKPGAQIVSMLTGSDNGSDYTSVGHLASHGVKIWTKHRGNTVLAEAVKVLAGDPKAAQQAYALQSGRCACCNRRLTVPASLNAGLGPECAKR